MILGQTRGCLFSECPEHSQLTDKMVFSQCGQVMTCLEFWYCHQVLIGLRRMSLCIRARGGGSPRVITSNGLHAAGRAFVTHASGLGGGVLPVKGQGRPSLAPSKGSHGRQSKLFSKRCHPNCQTNPKRLRVMKKKEMMMFAISGALV